VDAADQSSGAPFARVTAQASRGSDTRLITSEPLKGETIAVEVPTHRQRRAVLSRRGANVSLSASWDCEKHKRFPFEIYGSEGSLHGARPEFLHRHAAGDGAQRRLDRYRHRGASVRDPEHETSRSGVHVGDYRIVGLLDMAAALRQGRPHRASGALALHVLEVLDAVRACIGRGTAYHDRKHVRAPEPYRARRRGGGVPWLMKDHQGPRHLPGVSSLATRRRSTTSRPSAAGASLGYKGVQIFRPGTAVCSISTRRPSVLTYCDEVKGVLARTPRPSHITELSTHLQGQLVAVASRL
jgi:hypothetical protein